MHFYCLDGLLIIHNPELAAAVAVAGLNISRLKEQRADKPIELDFEISGDVLAYGVGLTVEEAAANARWLLDHANVEEAVAQSQAVINGLPDDGLVWRAVAYGRMMSIPAGEGVCLLTDHILLPLSWNRDAYFIARALLSAGQQDLVRRHLIWTFETAERRSGVWARCYMANGRIKDEAFQLDQQLYPLLELAEYVLETDDQVTFARLYPHIDAVLMAVDARRVGVRLLFPTDETPADDPIDLPYHLSSHILMWHTLTKLYALGTLGSWSERISGLYQTIQESFVGEHNGRRLYAYAIDGLGGFHFYHDANDFPLPLAPTWNFVSADDPIWQATIEFAFSEMNEGGFYDGRLGSIHTPAPWPLGDVQELIIARTLHDKAREENALAHLRAAAQSDGALPEAYDAASGSVISRHWFAWPNAAYACAELGAFAK